jgi:hypothetical protein
MVVVKNTVVEILIWRHVKHRAAPLIKGLIGKQRANSGLRPQGRAEAEVDSYSAPFFSIRGGELKKRESLSNKSWLPTIHRRVSYLAALRGASYSAARTAVEAFRFAER